MGLKGKKANIRRHSGGGRRPDLNDVHKREAEERQAAWSNLGLQGQLSALDVRLGAGVGANRQRARLAAAVEAAKAPKPRAKADAKADKKAERKEAPK